ncbi:MAG: hypothetical protein HY543_10680 [Deltaproteobacteria bacterium]|nr:hypothetical protein [Deltaproteobacteria bacterium]
MNQGTYNLGSVAVTTALTNSVITTGTSPAGAAQAFLDRFEGMQSLAIFCNFVYGSGGTTCAAVVQTTFDDTNWIDIARFDFTTSSGAKVANLLASLSKAVTAVAALSAEGVLDGILGAKLRTRVTSTGTYAGTTSIAVYIGAR